MLSTACRTGAPVVEVAVVFDHFVWSVVVTPLLVLGGTRLLVDRLRPDLAARAFAVSALVVAVASTANLVVFAVKALAELPVVATLGDWSHDTVVADTAYVPWVSWLSLACLPVVAVAVTREWRRHSVTVHAASAELDGVPDDDAGVVVLPGGWVDAFAVPATAGRPGRVVVTEGMRDLLDDRQYAALVAHERAHLAGGHHLLVRLAGLAAAAHPLLRPVAGQVAYLVERAADEAAAAELGDRGGVARAIGIAALAATRSRGAALSAVGAHPGSVPRRVAALAAAGPRRWALLLVPLLLGVGTVVWTAECAYDLHELLSLARARGSV
jgi:Zn-dependent protease with chaperone function